MPSHPRNRPTSVSVASDQRRTKFTILPREKCVQVFQIFARHTVECTPKVRHGNLRHFSLNGEVSIEKGCEEEEKVPELRPGVQD